MRSVTIDRLIDGTLPFFEACLHPPASLCDLKEIPLTRPIRQIGTFGVVALVLLRVGIGWHFFKEGAKKFQGDGFTSVGFLQDAKGPLADYYKSMIPDRDGRERLNQEKTVAFWKSYRDQVKTHYGFDDKQTKKADDVYKLYTDRLQKFHEDSAEEIQEYLLECDRLENAKADKMREVAFLRNRIASKEVELRGTAKPWLDSLDLMGQQLQNNLNAIASREQKAEGPCLIPDRHAMAVDTIVKYVILGAGILLILGLFTRFASVVAMLFLFSVMSTQPPWVPGAYTDYFYYQMVEVLALLVLIAFAAGRFAGLDYVIFGLRMRCCPPKTVEL